jgi:hypothetical protein
MTSAKSSAHRPSITVHLSYPVSHDGKAISELTLRRPTVADQLASVEGGGGVAGIELRMVSILSGVPVEALHSIDFGDYMKIQAALRDLVT